MRTINGATTYHLYDDWNAIEDRGPGGAILARHFHGAVIDEVLATGKVNGPGNPVSTYYHQHDGLGSVTALTNETGALVESYRYDVYGTPAFYDSSLTPQPSSLASNRFLFTGREWLPALSLYDYRNRAYGPGIGRFLQTDPVRFDAKDQNIYRAVRNNPGELLDPFGLSVGAVGPFQSGMVCLAGNCKREKCVGKILPDDGSGIWSPENGLPKPGKCQPTIDAFAISGFEKEFKVPNGWTCIIQCDRSGKPTGKVKCDNRSGFPLLYIWPGYQPSWVPPGAFGHPAYGVHALF